MMNILETIEQTPPSASTDKAAKSTDADATVAAEDENLTTIMSEIDRFISDVVAEKEVAAVVGHLFSNAASREQGNTIVNH
jgi:hypothetical protein